MKAKYYITPSARVIIIKSAGLICTSPVPEADDNSIENLTYERYSW